MPVAADEAAADTAARNSTAADTRATPTGSCPTARAICTGAPSSHLRPPRADTRCTPLVFNVQL